MPGTSHGEHLGPMIRRLRASAGLSQDELAERVELLGGRGAGSVGRGDISRWERERRLAGPFWIRPLAAALNVPVEQLQAARGSSRAARKAVTPPAPTDVSDVLQSLLPPGESLAPLATSGGRRVGLLEADLVARRCHAYRLADDVVAGGDLVRPVLRELAAARELYNGSAHTETVGRALLVGIAELAQLAGWVASDAEIEGVDPGGIFRLGAIAAQEAGDKPLASHLLGTWGYWLANEGDAARGRGLVGAAEAEGRGATPRVQSLASARLAWTASLAGDSQGALRAMGAAMQQIEDAAPGEDAHRQWAYWVTRPEQEIMEARVYTQLHRPLRAVPLLRRVLAEYDYSHTREMALYLSWLAIALVNGGELEEGAEVAGRMLEMSATVSSARASGRRDVVLSALRPHAHVSDVAEVLSEWDVG